MTKLFSLEGRVALVTGASRGLGRSMALALAGCGAHVAVNGRNAAGIESILRADEAGGLQPAMAFSNGVALIVHAEDADAAIELLDAEAPRLG